MGKTRQTAIQAEQTTTTTPRLPFVTPKLTRHGNAAQLTQLGPVRSSVGVFGSFSSTSRPPREPRITD